jgi:hypothetical protein
MKELTEAMFTTTPPPAARKEGRTSRTVFA